MPKLLIYSHAFAPLIGGVETVVMALARTLAVTPWNESGGQIEVTLATPTPAREMDDAGLPFRVVRQPGPLELLRLLHNADIVHLAGPALLPLIMGLLIRKKMVTEHHGFQTVCPNGQLFYEPNQSPCPGHFMAQRHLECLRCNAKCGRMITLKMWLLTFVRRHLCRLVGFNVTPTEWLSSILRLPRMVTIPHGLPFVDRSHPSATIVSPPTFVFLGRLVETKGGGILLAAAKKLKDQGYTFHVKFLGDGPDRQKLERAVVANGIVDCVVFHGHASDEDIETAIASAVAVVMPSLGGEVFGLVAAETMFRGRLVIASNIGALREVIGDTGLLFEPGDISGLVHCMESVLEDIPNASGRGQQALQRAVQEFDVNRMAQRHLSLYRELVQCAE